MAIWDEAKRLRNLRVHGLDFIDAEEIWDDFTVTDEYVRQDYGERRWVTFGILRGEVVVSTPNAANTTDTSRSEEPIAMKRFHILKRPAGKTPAEVIDPDNPPWTDAMLGGKPIFRQGRGPQKNPTKVSTTLRLDPEVLEYFRAKGPGYQTRINDMLREAIAKKRAGPGKRRR